MFTYIKMMIFRAREKESGLMWWDTQAHKSQAHNKLIYAENTPKI